MKHLYKICLSLSVIAAMFFFMNASTGPGANFGTGYTNAPFDGAYCTNCHGGGDFDPVLSIELRNGSTPVSTYIPNTAYTVHLELSTSTGLTQDTRYGFQIVGVRTSDNANTGTWGSLSATNFHTVTINSRVYVEHSQRLDSGIIDIPWTAPATGTGNVRFYAAGNIVNMDFNPTGDNPTATTQLFAPDPLAITWLYFTGKEQKGNVLLEWATTNELHTGDFILEKSQDGKSFTEFASLKAKASAAEKNIYTYSVKPADESNYFRVKHKDVDGSVSIYKIIQVSLPEINSGNAYVKNGQLYLSLSSVDKQHISVKVFSMDGRMIEKTEADLNAGNNSIELHKPEIGGVYLLYVNNGRQMIYSGKVLIE